MGIYFFDVTDGVERTRDEFGKDLPNREAARLHAQSLLAEMVQGSLPDGHRRDFIVDVRDSHAIMIYTCVLALSVSVQDHA